MERVPPDVRAVLDRLSTDQARVLGSALVGRYLFGSVATGSYLEGISDVDTVTILRDDPNEAQFESLAELHGRISWDLPTWKDRVEVVYLTSEALVASLVRPARAARISPGEPFDRIHIDRAWLIDWYRLRVDGVVLEGPAIGTIVPPIEHAEYVEAVRLHLLAWPPIEESPFLGELAYAILSMCRGLRTVRLGEPGSKTEAARWAGELIPRYASLIGEAIEWRFGPGSRGATSSDVDRTRIFIGEVQAMLAGTLAG